MGKKLAVNVVVPDSSGQPMTFLAGAEVGSGEGQIPQESADTLGDHVWEGYDGTAADRNASQSAPGPGTTESVEDFKPDTGAGDVPPMGGAGSGKDAWAEYATGLGVEVTDDDTRDDIVARVKAAGHPVERA